MVDSRYVYDPLYGHTQYPAYLWKVMESPELQRLREVRLCNINSLCLTGAGSVNRYEHALGTAYLAARCLDEWQHKPDQKTRRRILLAALLHDVGSAAFGHSVQYVLGRDGYEHESLYDLIQPSEASTLTTYRYQHTRVEPIYFGMPRRLTDLISSEDLLSISDMISGRGPFGPLISGTVDLDNLDNVYRLAYHMGLVRSGQSALDLARSMWVEDGHLVVKNSARVLLAEWQRVRQRLYRYLLLNPEEFSAKCMLQDAMERARDRSTELFFWHDVDFQLLEKLSRSSPEVAAIVSRLVIGDLYGCLGIYSTSRIRASRMLGSVPSRRDLENDIAKRIRRLGERHGLDSLEHALVAFHVIRDVNKTSRLVKVRTEEGRQLRIGKASRRVLIGVFFKNVHLSMTRIRRDPLDRWGVRKLVLRRLRSKLRDPDIAEMVLYGEAKSEQC